MKADALRMRAKRPFVFTNLKNGQGVDQTASFVTEKGGLAESAGKDAAELLIFDPA
jgi:urease accessory protein